MVDTKVSTIFYRFMHYIPAEKYQVRISRLQARLRAFRVLQETMVQIDAMIWALF